MGQFGIDTFRREITAELGEGFWNRLTEGLTLPDIDREAGCGCRNMVRFLERLEHMAEPETVKKILCQVRHGLTPDNGGWAREKFLELGDLDAFLKYHLENEMASFEKMNAEGKDFFGQEITDEVLEFLREHPSMLAPVREGNKLRCMAFPGNMREYLRAETPEQKRYYACHCPFARESILAGESVSPTLCNCSLGHVMNFAEGFLGRALEGRVVRSALGGGLLCEYEISLPDDVMLKYVTAD